MRIRGMQYQISPDGTIKYFPRRVMTNAERQADFRARNPGYYQKYKARYRAAKLACLARCQAEYRQAEAIAQQQQSIFRPMQLCLPAPTVSLEMEQINALRRKLEREAVVVRR